jgi:hypothetical protein
LLVASFICIKVVLLLLKKLSDKKDTGQANDAFGEEAIPLARCLCKLCEAQFVPLYSQFEANWLDGVLVDQATNEALRDVVSPAD